MTTITMNSTAGLPDGCTIVIDGVRYKIRAHTNTTLTVVKANPLERMFDWLKWKLNSLKWAMIEKYYEITDKIIEEVGY